MTDDEALRKMIEDATGLSLLDDEIERRLTPFVADRVAKLGLASRAEYVASLRRGPASAEWVPLIEALTNGQTSFFRDPDQLDIAIDLLAAMAGRGPYRVWCAGCATGQEAYSLAILCAERKLPVTIVATDLNPRYLDRARTGWYGEWEVRKVEPPRRARWFEPTGGGWRLIPEIRAVVDLRRHNLIDPPLRPATTDNTWHLVLCRNVFLYFRRERMAEVVARIAPTLSAEGRLILSASETLHGLDVPYRPEPIRSRIVYAPARDPVAKRPGLPRPATNPASPPPPPTTPAPTPPSRPARVSRSSLTIPVHDRINALARANRIADAIKVAEGIAEPRLLDHLTLGHLYLREREIDAAIAAYERAAEAEPLSTEVYYFLGCAYRKAGQWDDAANALRKALFLAPSFWQAAYLLAGTYLRLDRAAEAQREWARVRRLFFLRDRLSTVAFVSHPLFAGWAAVDEDEARRWLQNGARDGVME
jgi:chemotaxis protein methyltransferase CheR